MESSFGRNILCATVAIAILTACGGSGSSVPNGASPFVRAQNGFARDAGIVFSGVYEGKFRHKTHGASRVMLILSQSQNTLGGAVISKEGSQGLAAAIAWVASGHAISGNATVPAGSSSYCTFSMSGKYRVSEDYRHI